MLYFLIAAIAAVLIYRQGLRDGQRLQQGERVPPIKVIPTKKPKETSIERGLKNIINYGIGGINNAKR